MNSGINEDFLENRFDKSFGYRFYHWANIDTFIYFTHSRLTIPPPAWTHVAHSYGVKMLGTLCFEWDDGKLETEWMLEGVLGYCTMKIDGVLGYNTLKIGEVGVEYWAEKLA